MRVASANNPRDGSIRYYYDSTSLRLRFPLKWEHQKRVDLAAVEDDKALDKAERHLCDGDLVEIAAGREELAVAVVHDAHGEKIGAGLGNAIRDAADLRRADDMAIAVRLEDVGLAHRHDAIGQHARRGGIDDAVAQPGLVALPIGDQITAVLDKEIGPVLQSVIVDAIGISGIEVADREAQREIVHRVVARLRRPSARGISSRSRGSLPRWRGKSETGHHARPS